MARGSKVGDLAGRNPISGVGCCARAASDHATAVPRRCAAVLGRSVRTAATRTCRGAALESREPQLTRDSLSVEPVLREPLQAARNQFGNKKRATARGQTIVDLSDFAIVGLDARQKIGELAGEGGIELRERGVPHRSTLSFYFIRSKAGGRSSRARSAHSLATELVSPTSTMSMETSSDVAPSPNVVAMRGVLFGLATRIPPSPEHFAA
jgi:hypothetical protein